MAHASAISLRGARQQRKPGRGQEIQVAVAGAREQSDYDTFSFRVKYRVSRSTRSADSPLRLAPSITVEEDESVTMSRTRFGHY